MNPPIVTRFMKVKSKDEVCEHPNWSQKKKKKNQKIEEESSSATKTTKKQSLLC